MEKLFLIGAAGYVALSIYTHRLKRNYAEGNSNRFLIDVMIWGALPYIADIIFKHYANRQYFLKEFFNNNPDLVFPAEALTLLVFSVGVGLFASTEEIDKFKNWFSKSFITHNERDPLTSGLVEYDWMRFTKSEETLIFTLKNNKVYVGIILFADYKGNMSPELRAIRITPLKSGIRNTDGSVNYTTFYFTPDQLEKNDNIDTAKMSNEEFETYFEQFEQKYIDAISVIEDLVLFQREIVSYTIYSNELDDRFHGEKVNPENIE